MSRIAKGSPEAKAASERMKARWAAKRAATTSASEEKVDAVFVPTPAPVETVQPLGDVAPAGILGETPQTNIEVKSMLEDGSIGEDSDVKVYNILSEYGVVEFEKQTGVEIVDYSKQPFSIRFSVEGKRADSYRPGDGPRARDDAGIPKSKEGGGGRTTLDKYIVLQPGEVRVIPGATAKIVIKVLRNLAIQLEAVKYGRGSKSSVADKFQQRKFEERIVLSVTDRFGMLESDPSGDFDRKMAELNQATAAGAATAAKAGVTDGRTAFPSLGAN